MLIYKILILLKYTLKHKIQLAVPPNFHHNICMEIKEMIEAMKSIVGTKLFYAMLTVDITIIVVVIYILMK